MPRRRAHARVVERRRAAVPIALRGLGSRGSSGTVVDAVREDALVHGGIVRMDESSPGRGRCRSYSRDSQNRSAAARGSVGPLLALVRGQRARPPRSPRRTRRCDPAIERAVRPRYAPVVHGDREIVGEEIRRGEAEVDDARRRGPRRTARCRRTGRRGSPPRGSRAACRCPIWSLSSAASSAFCASSSERAHRARRLAPPRRAAPVVEGGRGSLRGATCRSRERRADRHRSPRRSARGAAHRRCGSTRPAGLPFSSIENSAPVRSGAGAGTATPACARCAIRLR